MPEVKVLWYEYEYELFLPDARRVLWNRYVLFRLMLRPF